MKNAKFDIHERVKSFVLRVVKMAQKLPKNEASFVFSKQIIRSASSIGANLAEGGGSVSKKEFVNFLAIARKSALESRYWLDLIVAAELLPRPKMKLLLDENEEIIKILTRILLNAKAKK